VAGQIVAGILGGRGGGSGPLYHGKGERLDQLDEAVAALAHQGGGAAPTATMPEAG
jgi:hypothetical protein